jgi:hypothetical protein
MAGTSSRNEDYASLIGSKKRIPLKISFFIDAYHFLLSCRRLTEEKRYYYVKGLGRDHIPTDVGFRDLPIEPETAATGHAILDSLSRKIVDRMVQLSEKELGLSLYWLGRSEKSRIVWESALGDDEWIASEKKAIESADAVVDLEQTYNVYAGKPPTKSYLKRVYKNKLREGNIDEGSFAHQLLTENIKLAEDRKLKTSFKNDPLNLDEYENFLEELTKNYAFEDDSGSQHYANEDDRGSHRLGLGVTRVDVANTGTVSLGEKGVDAYLMLGLLDELENSETSAICLISNDSDHYPIVERMKEQSSRPFFLGVTGPKKRVSSSLRSTVGDEWIVPLDGFSDVNQEFPYLSSEWMVALGLATKT